MNTNHPTTRNTDFFEFANSTYEQCNSEYNEIIREVAADLPGVVELLDIEQQVRKSVFSGKIALQDFLLKDGLHLSPMGHEFYFDIVKGPVLSAVERIMQDLSK